MSVNRSVNDSDIQSNIEQQCCHYRKINDKMEMAFNVSTARVEAFQ